MLQICLNVIVAKRETRQTAMSAERLVTLGTADSLLNLHIQMNCFIGNLKAIFYVYCHDKGASLSLAVN